MCGLVGMAGNLAVKEETSFKQLLMVDSLRGPHSVGIAAVSSGGAITIRKKAIPVNDFLEAAPVEAIFRGVNRVLIGHNRWATRGAVSNYNAHPFLIDKIVGAHNGSLTNMKLLPDSEMFNVDSEAIFNSIETLGVAETGLRLHGAWALTWYDSRDETLHMWRNDDRPLFYVFSEDRKCIFWASEVWMLLGILARNGIKHTEVHDVAPHYEYKFVIPMKNGGTINEISIVPVKAYTPPAAVNNFSGGTYVNGKWIPNSKKQMSLVTTTTRVGSTNTMRIGTKVAFFIDSLLERSATAEVFHVDTHPVPLNLDTDLILVSNVSHNLKKIMNQNFSAIYEGVICGRTRSNDKIQSYAIQGNSVKLLRGTGALIDQDTPPYTITIGQEELTRREFDKVYKGCTCSTCGMDLEFVSGHSVAFSNKNVEIVTCVDCVEDLYVITKVNR